MNVRKKIIDSKLRPLYQTKLNRMLDLMSDDYNVNHLMITIERLLKSKVIDNQNRLNRLHINRLCVNQCVQIMEYLKYIKKIDGYRSEKGITILTNDHTQIILKSILRQLKLKYKAKIGHSPMSKTLISKNIGSGLKLDNIILRISPKKCIIKPTITNIYDPSCMDKICEYIDCEINA